MQVENRSARLLNVTATPFLLPMNPYHTKALSLWFTRAPERYPNPLCNPHEDCRESLMGPEEPWGELQQSSQLQNYTQQI